MRLLEDAFTVAVANLAAASFSNVEHERSLELATISWETLVLVDGVRPIFAARALRAAVCVNRESEPPGGWLVISAEKIVSTKDLLHALHAQKT